jgi:hypothetical protein
MASNRQHKLAMSLKEKNQSFFQRYHALLMPLLLALLSYAGIDGYGKIEEYRAEQAAIAPAEVTTTITVERGGSDLHTHPAVAHKHDPHAHRGTATIQTMIDQAVATHQVSKTYHEYTQ